MSIMLDEIREQPDVIELAIKREEDNAKKLVAEVKRRGIRSIVIAARGTSDNAADYAKYLLEIVAGVPTGLAAPSVFTLYRAQVDYSSSLVLGISQSGQATDVVETLHAARISGALTACITNVPESPLTDVSDFALCCHAGEEKSVAATKTYTATLALVALIVCQWTGSKRLQTGLAAASGSIAAMLKIESTIAGTVERYRYMRECAVLARGLNHATAKEAALKIMETSYLAAEAYSGADFMHGPIAMVSHGFPCLLFVPDGAAFAGMRDLTRELKDLGAETIVVARAPEVLGMAARPIQVPVPMDELVSPLAYIVAGQLFAYHLALARGLDPDSPRRLQKVTLTR